MTGLNWAQIAARDYTLPPGVNVSEVLPELLNLLASPDPAVRDGQAYTTLAVWLQRGTLDDFTLQVGQQVTALLAAPEVHTRSFAALILAEVFSRDATVQRLDLPCLHSWQNAWADWYVNEQDLRPYTPERGWLHALAHGADVAAGLAGHPALTRAELRRALNTLLRRIQRVNVVAAQFEDDRVALAAFLLLSRPELTPLDRLRWLVGLRALMRPVPGQPRAAGSVFAVQAGRALLMFTHFGAPRPDGTVVAGRADLRAPLMKALKGAFFYPA